MTLRKDGRSAIVSLAAATRPVLAVVLPIAAGAVALWQVRAFIAATAPTDIVFVDWLTYALGTERAFSGLSLYLPEQLAGPYHLPHVTPEGYIYPPPSAILFAPFAPAGFGVVAWIVANVGVLFSGLGAVARRELPDVWPFAWALGLLGLSVSVALPGGTVAPFPNGVLNANVNVALAGAVAWAWAVGPDRRWIPWLAGVAGAFKVFPAALALWAARRGGWRPLLLAVGIAAAICAVTLPLFGIGEWSRFLTALANAQPTCDGGRASLPCALLPFLEADVAKLAAVAVGAALLGASLLVRADLPAFVLLVLGMLAPVTDGHHHYGLFLYVLAVIAACRVVARAGVRRRAPSAA